MMDVREALTPIEEAERAEFERSFREILASRAGQRVMFWILEQCAMYREAFTGENNLTNYTLGQQASGRKIIAQMDAIDPRLYPKLLTDMAENRALDKEAAERAARAEEPGYD